jgi:hypothetical protein
MWGLTMYLINPGKMARKSPKVPRYFFQKNEGPNDFFDFFILKTFHILGQFFRT